MKIRLISWHEDNENFVSILKKLEEINLVKIVEVSKSYPNRGNSVCERKYIELSINPEFNAKKIDVLEANDGK